MPVANKKTHNTPRNANHAKPAAHHQPLPSLPTPPCIAIGLHSPSACSGAVLQPWCCQARCREGRPTGQHNPDPQPRANTTHTNPPPPIDLMFVRVVFFSPSDTSVRMRASVLQLHCIHHAENHVTNRSPATPSQLSWSAGYALRGNTHNFPSKTGFCVSLRMASLFVRPIIMRRRCRRPRST